MKLANISKNTRIIGLAILAVVLFAGYSFLRFGNEYQRYSWPDEMANSVFIDQFRQTGTLVVPEERNEVAGNIINPRSVNVYQHQRVPAGFLGMPLIYG